MSDVATTGTYQRPWFAWIPLVGPILEFVNAAEQNRKNPQREAIDEAATTQGDAVTQAQTDLLAALTEAKEQFKPYSDAGLQALQNQQALLGLSGPEKQQAAVSSLAESPQMAAMTAQGENAILQNASATGGLRGGNVQGALAQFRPQVLSNLINQQYQNLGGLSNMGFGSASQQANLGVQGAQTSGDLAQQLAAIQSGQTLSQAALTAGTEQEVLDLASQFAGYAAGGGF